jgi:glycosyltransferase involved in cell wall biosynthesis
MSSGPETNERPTVSVIVTTKNRAPLLREALESVLRAHSDRYILELIVVDDGSTDETAQVLSRYPVTLLRTEGVGMARARNLGLNAAKGDFVTLLDDDDMWLPDNVILQLDEFERHPEYASVHGKSQLVEYDGVPFGRPVPAGPLSSGWIFEDLLGYMPQVASILTRTSAAREAGEMDPTLTGDTDWDWLLRIAWKHPIGRVDKPVMLFRQRKSTNEDFAWRRFPATVRVFQRHVQKLPIAKRLKLNRVLWKHRGHWSASFFGIARSQLANGDKRRALRSTYYALRASPIHLALAAMRALGGRA